MRAGRPRKSTSYNHANLTQPTATDRAARQLAADAAEFQAKKRSHKKSVSRDIDSKAPPITADDPDPLTAKPPRANAPEPPPGKELWRAIRDNGARAVAERLEKQRQARLAAAEKADA